MVYVMILSLWTSLRVEYIHSHEQPPNPERSLGSQATPLSNCCLFAVDAAPASSEGFEFEKATLWSLDDSKADPAPLLVHLGNLGVIITEDGAPRNRLLRPLPAEPVAAVVFPIMFM